MFPYQLDTAAMLVGAQICLGIGFFIALFCLGGFFILLLRREKFFTSIQAAIVLIAVPLILPACFASLFATSTISTLSFMDGAVTTTGTVVRHEENHSGDSRTFDPIIQFETATGQIVEYDDQKTCAPPCYPIGHELTVLYHPDNPEGAITQSAIALWTFPAVFALLAGVFLIAGVGIAFVRFRKGNLGSVGLELAGEMFAK